MISENHHTLQYPAKIISDNLSLKPLSGFRGRFRKGSGFDWFLISLTRSIPAAVNYVIL